jgi:hypothetical protein
MIWCEGNHEYRIERLIDEHPVLEGMIEPEIVLRLKERNIEYIKSWSEGKTLRLGKCLFSHGLYCNDAHAKKHVQHFGSSILYGHTHDVQVYSSHAYGFNDAKIGASLGCLCLPQKYMRGAPTRWVQAVTVFTYDKRTGNFWFEVLRINNHQLIYNGEVFDG